MAEFLLQAIGEFDAGGIAVLAVASVTVFVVRQLLGTVATEWLRGLLNPSRKADASGSGLARPQPLGSHRQPGNRPARPFQGSTPEKLARSMRCSGRVPISHYRHQRWLVAFWRAVKLYLFPVKTLPKSAFTAVDWQYEPSALTGLAAGHPYCGGFELRVRLHRHENRYHLRRSLQVGGLRARSRRLVVIASARDIFDPESWVRYLVVDADTLCLPKQSRGWVAVRGADPSSVDAPVVHRLRRKEVPDGAVWLIVPTSAYCPPAADSEEAADRLDPQTRATIEAAPQDCRDIDNEDYVRDWVIWNRMVTLAIWGCSRTRHIRHGHLGTLFGTRFPGATPNCVRDLRRRGNRDLGLVLERPRRRVGSSKWPSPLRDLHGAELAAPREPGTQRLEGRDRRVPHSRQTAQARAQP